MKITDLIEGYADMSAEEKLEALEGYEPDTTETDKWKKQYDKTAHELAEIKKANKSLQEQLNSKLTEDELAQTQRQAEIEAIIAERDQLKRDNAISQAAAQYIGLGYSHELAVSTATALYDQDFDTVIANAGTFKEGIEQEIRANVVKSNPVPTDKGASTKTMTKAEIMAIKDTAQRQQAISEHPDLFR